MLSNNFHVVHVSPKPSMTDLFNKKPPCTVIPLELPRSEHDITGSEQQIIYQLYWNILTV